MSEGLDVLLKRLHLANARRVWRDLVQRAEKEQWSHDRLLDTLFAEEVAHRRGTRIAVSPFRQDNFVRGIRVYRARTA
jgi:hypothetical protein